MQFDTLTAIAAPFIIALSIMILLLDTNNRKPPRAP